MDLKMQIKTLETLYKIIKGGNTEDEAHAPQKPKFNARDNSGIFEELLPEQVGVRSEGLLKMFYELSESSEICPHSMLVLKDGKLIAKADWSPFTSEYPHVSHSLCKSITSMAVGIAVKEKYISTDDKISEIFADEMPTVPNKFMKEITVRHLLTMSSGVKFNEAGMLMSSNWVKSYLSSDVFFEPGTDFHYNSMNSYMLSAALCRRTGLSLSEYLSRRLFAPMGINGFHWETCPLGFEKGGWGLYMNIYDYAKLGQLYLNGGVWDGVQLIPQSWISESASKQILKTNSPCSDGYGYQVWIAKNKNGYTFNGMFGQNVFVFPKRNVVIAMTAGSSNLFPKCRAMNIVAEFIENNSNFSKTPIRNFRYANAAALRNALSGARFGRPLVIKEKPSFFARLRQSLMQIGNTSVIPEAAEVLNGVGITFEKNNAGLLPVLIQVMNKNLEHGIEQASFSVKSGRFVIRVDSGASATYVPVSFADEPVYFDLERNGEIFRVGVTGRFNTDEDELPVLKVVLCFVETSCSKILKFVFGADGIILKIRESPQLYGALDEIADMVMPMVGKNMQKTFEAILETDVAEYKIKSFLEPTLRGKFILNK